MIRILIILLFAISPCLPIFSQDLHFHETGGFGTSGIYGMVGEIYRVTNLQNDGEGSLRFGLELTSKLLPILELSSSRVVYERQQTMY